MQNGRGKKMNNIFSINNEKFHKTINFLGLKFKIISKKALLKEFKKLNYFMTRMQIPTLYLADLTKEEKEWYLSKIFYEETGYFPDLKNPKSFNEKINWMKLNYYNPIEKNIIDKYEFKNYIKEKLGEGYTIPAIGIYNGINEIDFTKLPSSFVIKITNQGSAQGVKIIKDKRKIDIGKLKYELNDLMQNWNSIYWWCFSRGYKDIKPRILIEEYMPIREGKALEYKMFCFHGEVKFCLIECDYFGKNPKRAFYDKNFNEMPFKIGKMPKVRLKNKPENYDLMVKIAEKLSESFPFVRVDFYDIKGKVYAGEMTFTSGGGFSKIYPVEWDFKMGEWLNIKDINQQHINQTEENSNEQSRISYKS